MHRYNKYSQESTQRIQDAIQELSIELQKDKRSDSDIHIGIQGGKGSFNEETILNHLNANPDKFNQDEIQIKYLITSESVLSKLNTGEIDYGLFAIQNSGSGAVIPSMEAMAKYNFEIVEVITTPIIQCLMIHQDANVEKITKVFSHPQAILQCSQTLTKSFPHLEKIMGNDHNDTAITAKELSEGNLSQDIAVIASKTAAKIYNLNIIEEGIHDDPSNKTTFLFVKRRSTTIS
jgi:prephenate dehydratase